MATFDQAGDTVRKIAGYLPYNPGPGIYSRLEKAIEAMPENVRVQELPGLLKRYRDGVPGWELKATDLDALIDGRDVVPKAELLERVKDRSPVYTHKELILGGSPDRQYHPGVWATDSEPYWTPDLATGPSAFGQGRPYGSASYEDYGQGGKGYTELLLLQPGAGAQEFSTHWHGKGSDAVAHARFDTHGDALRINELQSDLGIHNRKVREAIASHQGPPPQLPSESDSAYLDRVQEQGYVMQMGDDGEWQWANDPKSQGIHFPLEDSWADLLIKRLALEAAQKGHRAIEVASPRSIADKVGGNIDNYEHFYGKVVPGAIERLGRKMGGLAEEATGAEAEALTPFAIARKNINAEKQALRESAAKLRNSDDYGAHFVGARGWRAFADMEYAADPLAYDAGLNHFGGRVINQSAGDYGTPDIAEPAHDMYRALVKHEGFTPEQAARLVGEAIYRAEGTAQIRKSYLTMPGVQMRSSAPEAGRRYIMSDEMRRRILEGGIGAAVAAPVLSEDDLIERLNQ